MAKDIFQYITEEENRFQAGEIQVADNWRFSFRNHVQLIFHLKNNQFFSGDNNWLRAFKNIMEPVLNLSYWAEDIELKDVVFYIENKAGRILSFLVKKYHDEVYVKKNNLDTLFDEITEDDLDYGGVIVQKGKTKPEVMPLQSIAFCDQTNVLGGPIGFKYNFSPDKLRDMASAGWGNEANGATISLDELITLAKAEKDSSALAGQKNITTGKNIEVYIVRGNLPEHFLKNNDNNEDWYNQVQIVAFYKTKKNTTGRQGEVLYRKKEEEGNIKFHTSKKVHGRALGRGVGEGLLHPQIWTNFLEIHKMNFLEAASKVPLYTDDPNFANRNKIQDMENLEITTIDSQSKYGIRQVPTAAPANIQLFSNAISEWYEQAQLTGSAFDPMLGKQPSSGTTFRGQERVVFQGRGLHERRRGQRAKFIEEIYRDWIIPDIKKEILKGKEFLATLSSDELGWISDQLAENYANKNQIEDILNGEQPRDKETLRQTFLTDFHKKGNKHIIKILKDEFADVEIKLGISVGAKQKDLAGMTDKLLAIFQQVLAAPQILQNPAMADIFQQIIELSGLNPVDFNKLTAPMPQLAQQSQQSPQLSALQNITPQPAAIA